jgi:hypothetical protein
MLNKSYKKFLIGLVVFVIGSCAVLFAYMTLFRWVDYAICIPLMARKVGVSPSIGGIESYIFETALPGMEREDVLNVLEKLGPVNIRSQDATYPPDEIRDTILINSCMHPLNDLDIYAFYNSGGKLTSITLLNTIE